MIAILPAAGRGTRMASITGNRPKEILPFLEKPVIQWVLEEAAKAGAGRAAVIVSNEKPELIEFLESESAFAPRPDKAQGPRPRADDLDMVYQEEPDGHGAAVALVDAAESVLVLNPDTAFFPGSPSGEIAMSLNNGLDIVLAVEEVDESKMGAYGIVDVDSSGRIRRILEKPRVSQTQSRLAIAGRFGLSPKAFAFLKRRVQEKKSELRRLRSDRTVATAKEISLTAILGEGIHSGELAGSVVKLSANQIRLDFGDPQGYNLANGLGKSWRLTRSFSAPGRCGIVGNPSDIYGGVVLSCSVPARAKCTLTTSEQWHLPEDRTLWHAATARFNLPCPFEVSWSSDVPRSSGLAGSTALLAATLACVAAFAGRDELLQDRIGFSELVRDVERHEAGVVCGYQDAYMAVHGGLQVMDFAGKGPSTDSSANRVPSRLGPDSCIETPSTARIAPIEWEGEMPFLLVTTGVERLSGGVHGPMVERWLANEPAVVQGVDRIARLGRIGAEAMRCRDWEALAEAMNENQRIIRSLGGSGDSIDQLVERCLRNGARAAKLAGAGLGGTVITLCDSPKELANKLYEQGYRKFLRPKPVIGLTPSLGGKSVDPEP